ncbi:MAG: hypothetical protein FJ304_25930 [Planctomycetes bacterium]|nr:hypothetical protein [Planctomycetota bacterium]
MRWIVPALCVLTLTTPATADEPKPAAQTAAEIKKQIADLQTQIAKKKAEHAKVIEGAKAIEAEGKKVIEQGQKKARDIFVAGQKALEPRVAKVKDAQTAAGVAIKAAEDAARAAQAAADKARTATDPAEAEALKKKAAELDAAAKGKLDEARKSAAAAGALNDELNKAAAAVRAEADAAARATDAAARPYIEKVADARKTATKLEDEILAAELNLRKLKFKLEDLEPKK